MIIIGYQGIGKSSVSGVDSGCIDLESSNFWHEGVRADDWYIYYCNIALDLSKQGFTVFTSSHKEVRDYLLEYTIYDFITTVFPERWLKDEWINRLQKRYDAKPSNKNYKALMNAKDRFEDNVKELKEWGGGFYGIQDMDYDLMDIVKHLRSKSRLSKRR